MHITIVALEEAAETYSVCKLIVKAPPLECLRRSGSSCKVELYCNITHYANPIKTWHMARILQPLAAKSGHLICFYPPRKPCSSVALHVDGSECRGDLQSQCCQCSCLEFWNGLSGFLSGHILDSIYE